MDKAETHHRFKPWRATTRLAVSTGLGIIAYFAIHRFRPDLPAGILAWDVGVFGFLLLTYRVIADHSIEFDPAAGGHARHPRFRADDARRRGGLRQPLWAQPQSRRAAGPSGAARDPGRGDGGRLLVADPHRLLAALCPFLLRGARGRAHLPRRRRPQLLRFPLLRLRRRHDLPGLRRSGARARACAASPWSMASCPSSSTR